MLDSPPPPKWVDTHAHLADTRLLGRLDAVLAAAAAIGVEQIVAIATDAADSATVVALAQQYPQIRAAVGIHPNEASRAQPDAWDQVYRLAGDPAVVAIGETGLDRHWDDTPFPVQQDYFERHLRLAHELGLPVVIHSRECHADVVDQLARLGRPVRGVAHSFTGNWAEAESLLALGLHLSFAGMLTFANRSLDPLREAAQRIPADRLLVETDSPYLSPVPHRGQPNEPARVVHTASRLAELRGTSLAELAEQTTANAHNLFARRPT